MTAPRQWLDVVGIGEDGFAGLSKSARNALEKAEIIIGGDRHHALAPHLQAKRLRWSRPFSTMISEMATFKQHGRTALLVTGDPLWYSAGAKLLNKIPWNEMQFHPQFSAFQLACTRMGWSLADIDTLTAHGRPIERVIPYFRHHARLAVLTGGATAPHEAACLLVKNGFGRSRMTVLANLGGPQEKRLEGGARDWTESDPSGTIPPFHTLCIECVADDAANPLPRGPGLPDTAFETDGNFTKQDLRAITLCMLAPHRGALLWDIGTGCGTVAIEWMRVRRDCRAIGIDHNSNRLEMAKRNALRLGAPMLELIEGKAPEALKDLPPPDAIFIGGGINRKIAEICLASLRPHGRLVANAVTTESEAILAELHAEHQGALARIAVSHAKPLGSGRSWRSQMTITQWRCFR
ncbi:MAG: precorrin-6y C5,15-methyltransferase (decarboxylating) subunit CbiE [Rhodobacteraceae bacterium]|nr:precorrin-6y C5,15-methyltransferase (decarboxylating) subunit CbiE [Paracoccaceae bacterium]MCY4196297.1 precorrin-6y C5,15-methyltransferase (decarboxylating) subunit CbiE [Paracoccaceae bacterium]